MRFVLALLLFAFAAPAVADCGRLGSRASSLAAAQATAAQIGEPVVTIDNTALAQATADALHDVAGQPHVPAVALIALSGTKGVAAVAVVAPNGCVSEMIVLPSALLKQLIGEGI